jgi:hypothetical protein
MDAHSFDRWTRSLLSRRRAGLRVAALGASLLLPRPTAAVGRRDRPRAENQGDGRFGCTQDRDACVLPDTDPCPDAPAGVRTICVKANNGQSFCAGGGECASCRRHRDCAAQFGPTARCIKTCSVCKGLGLRTACLVPFTG